MKIFVLGSGPAGLMAASAAAIAHTYQRAPYDVSIFSLGNKSPLHGCQYLHRPIPGYTPVKDVMEVAYRLVGTPEGYREKVYGKKWDGLVSPEDLSEDHLGWDIRSTYNALWGAWQRRITAVEITPMWVSGLLSANPDALVINSIPRPELCYEGHHFGSIGIWAAGDAPAMGIRIPFEAPEGMVTCNGEETPGWYRMSRVFGHTTVEWPGYIDRVPVTTASRVQKPTKHDCDCWSQFGDRLVHVGRYGKWEKGVLSHTAYFDTLSMVENMLRRNGAAAEAEA